MDAATRTALERRFAYIFNGENGYPAICEAVDLPPWGAPFEIMGPSGPVPATAFAQGHGPIGSVELSFEGRFTRFGNLEKHRSWDPAE